MSRIPKFVRTRTWFVVAAGVVLLNVLEAGATAPLGRFTLTADTVFDNTTGLTWQRPAGATYREGAANTYCEGLTLGGYTDWRLPTIYELHTIVDLRGGVTGKIDLEVFPASRPERFWSSTSLWIPGWGSAKVCLNFQDGETSDACVTSNRVRCVRRPP